MRVKEGKYSDREMMRDWEKTECEEKKERQEEKNKGERRGLCFYCRLRHSQRAALTFHTGIGFPCSTLSVDTLEGPWLSQVGERGLRARGARAGEGVGRGLRRQSATDLLP